MKALIDGKYGDWRIAFLGRPGLVSLDLADTPIGAEDLDELKRLSAIVSLDVRGTRSTAGGVQRLQLALPRCQIDWGPSP